MTGFSQIADWENCWPDGFRSSKYSSNIRQGGEWSSSGTLITCHLHHPFSRRWRGGWASWTNISRKVKTNRCQQIDVQRQDEPWDIGVPRGGAIGLLPNRWKFIAQWFFRNVDIAQCRKMFYSTPSRKLRHELTTVGFSSHQISDISVTRESVWFYERKPIDEDSTK